jgi:hypothetical protein
MTSTPSSTLSSPVPPPLCRHRVCTSPSFLASCSLLPRGLRPLPDIGFLCASALIYECMPGSSSMPAAPGVGPYHREVQGRLSSSNRDGGIAEQMKGA